MKIVPTIEAIRDAFDLSIINVKYQQAMHAQNELKYVVMAIPSSKIPSNIIEEKFPKVAHILPLLFKVKWVDHHATI